MMHYQPMEEPMAVDARIRELGNRHTNLEQEIEKELKHPAHDPLHISDLKKQKLKLKEEILTLRQT
jgi:hypothetical protein